MKMKLKTERSSNMIQAILIGLGAGIAVILLGALLIAYLINAEKIAQVSAGVAGVVIRFAASLIGSFAAAKLMGGKYAFICAISGMVLLVVLMAAALLLSDSIHNIWQGILAVASGSVGACLLCLLSERKTNRVKMRSR